MGHNLSDAVASALRSGLRQQGSSPHFVCLFCSTSFEQGLVYRDGEALCDARHAARRHVEQAHGGPLPALLALGKPHTGLSELQREIIGLSYAGRLDKEIAEALGGRSASTIRNHRFQLRRRAREARVFLAVMDLLEAESDPSQTFIDFHPSIPADDDRIAVTESEADRLLSRYFTDGSRTRLERFPRKKQKHKLVILRHLVERFEGDRTYSEHEVNEVLGPVYDDHVLLRRYLVDYGFLTRHRDGSAYWRSDGR